jgi:hypothetical protein
MFQKADWLVGITLKNRFARFWKKDFPTFSSKIIPVTKGLLLAGIP